MLWKNIANTKGMIVKRGKKKAVEGRIVANSARHREKRVREKTEEEKRSLINKKILLPTSMANIRHTILKKGSCERGLAGCLLHLLPSERFLW